MSEVTVFTSPYITVRCDEDAQYIYHTVHRPITPDQDEVLKEALNKGTEALTEHGLSKWLSDDRKNGPLSQESLAWSAQDWTPRTIQAGWKYWANVVPEDIKAAGSLVPLIEDLAKYGLIMRVFTELESAKAWLEAQD